MQYDSQQQELRDTALSLSGVGTVSVSGPLDLLAGQQLLGTATDQSGAEAQDSVPVEESKETEVADTLLASLPERTSKPADPHVQGRTREAYQVSNFSSYTRA